MPDGEKEVKTRLLNPGIPIPAGASEVHGIKDEHVNDCPTFKDVSHSLADYMKDCDLIRFPSMSTSQSFIWRDEESMVAAKSAFLIRRCSGIVIYWVQIFFLNGRAPLRNSQTCSPEIRG